MGAPAAALQVAASGTGGTIPRAKSPIHGLCAARRISRFPPAPHLLATGQWQRSLVRRRGAISRAQIGDSLEEFLLDATEDLKLRQVIMGLSEALRTIAYKVKTASCSGDTCINTFGSEQLPVELLADKLLLQTLRYSTVCRLAYSENVDEPLDLGGDGFSIAFDPLDGSSVVDTNFTVGTIFGVWPGEELLGQNGYQQVAAGVGVYGPRTVLCVALADHPGAHEFLLQDDGKWIHVKETTEIGEGKIFSPGNLRAAVNHPQYQKLVDYYLANQYTLRYTGGLVPDVFQIIVKEEGVFTNISPTSAAPKLRVISEVLPLAYLVEKAGGWSSVTQQPHSALSLKVDSYSQRTDVCFGSKAEVKRFEDTICGSSPRFGPLANYKDPLEDFCQSSPGADECKIFEQ
mmetsp:Transcript_14140/g.40071  ORF Transcript_14140/g.40071 Transcript_14140/m.40071 type:complete len:403 (-) Transcript_14140:195-1403(-)